MEQPGICTWSGTSLRPRHGGKRAGAFSVLLCAVSTTPYALVLCLCVSWCCAYKKK